MDLAQKATETPLVVFCCPTVTRPYPAFLEALEASVPLLEAAGYRHAAVNEIGNPYISGARATMLRKALDAKADIIVFLDHDLSWRPGDLVKLVQTQGEVVAGLYRFKSEPEAYMGALIGDTPQVREADGAFRADRVPAGFLKVTKEAVHAFMVAYPGLCYGPRYHLSADMFNHGAHEGVWYGEDYAFSRNWLACGGEIWVVPDLDLTHHGADGAAYPGNFYMFMRRQPGGDLAEA